MPKENLKKTFNSSTERVAWHFLVFSVLQAVDREKGGKKGKKGKKSGKKSGKKVSRA